MKGKLFIGAVLAVATLPAVALADDPNDPAMRNPAARARDHEITRQLNLRESAMVSERDARYARENARGGQDSVAYAQNRAQYERDMARWHQAVAACQAGDTSACAH